MFNHCRICGNYSPIVESGACCECAMALLALDADLYYIEIDTQLYEESRPDAWDWEIAFDTRPAPCKRAGLPWNDPLADVLRDVRNTALKWSKPISIPESTFNPLAIPDGVMMPAGTPIHSRSFFS